VAAEPLQQVEMELLDQVVQLEMEEMEPQQVFQVHLLQKLAAVAAAQEILLEVKEVKEDLAAEQTAVVTINLKLMEVLHLLTLVVAAVLAEEKMDLAEQQVVLD
jgi:hypothetical protein